MSLMTQLNTRPAPATACSPKRLLLEFIWLLAGQSNIQAIYAVSDNGHVFRALRYRLSKGRHFHASYDEFWQSIEGVRNDSYRWRLPLKLERKSLESIASKKTRRISPPFPVNG